MNNLSDDYSNYTSNYNNSANSNNESMNTIILQGKTTEERCIHYIKNKRISKLSFIDLSLQVDLDANYIDEQGFTLLMYACIQPSNLSMVELLIKYNADMNAIHPMTGENVLTLATATPNNRTTIEYLLSKGAHVQTPQILLRNLFKNSISEGIDEDLRNLIEEIMNRGGNLHITDDQGLYPYEYGTLALFDYFRKKYNLEYKCTATNKYPLTYYTIEPNQHVISSEESIQTLHNRYIESLGIRSKFILQQYTHIGDTFVNQFLRGKLTLSDYKVLTMDIDRDRFAIHKYIVCPFLYCMLDDGTIDCISDNYLLFFYEEIVQPRIKEIIIQKNTVLLDKYFYHYFIDLYKNIQEFPKVSAPFTVYRGVERNYLRKNDPSTPLLLPTFTSTSTKETTARSYGPILYRFTVHPLCNYAFIDPLSINAGEDEVLIAPYTKYVVKHINEDQTVWDIDLFPSDITIQSYEDFQSLHRMIHNGGGIRKRRQTPRRKKLRITRRSIV